MATPLNADQFVQALRGAGVTVVEHPGWRTHNRNHVGEWGPVNGVMIHHTVSSGTASSVELCYNGYAELPGPLCHGVIAKDGSVHLVGNGRANHAGGGDPNVLKAVIDERYTTNPPDTHQHQGSAGAVDGNAHFYGFECINLGDGKDPWPAVQVSAITKVAAALCRAHGWSEKSVIGHSEWSDWKNDPRGPGMPAMSDLRTEVKARLAGAPAGGGDEDAVSLSDNDIARLAQAVWDHGISNRFRPGNDGKPKVIPARYFLEWSDHHYDQLRGDVAGVDGSLTDAQVKEIAGQLAAAPGLVDSIAARVADMLATRLAK
jgi:N-acetylmuramoyl-L-alanine amidase